jgi:hypothetical protein
MIMVVIEVSREQRDRVSEMVMVVLKWSIAAGLNSNSW